MVAVRTVEFGSERIPRSLLRRSSIWHHLFSIHLFLHGKPQFLYDIGLSHIGARTEGLGGNQPVRLRKAAHDNCLLLRMNLKDAPVGVQSVHAGIHFLELSGLMRWQIKTGIPILSRSDASRKSIMLISSLMLWINCSVESGVFERCVSRM